MVESNSNSITYVIAAYNDQDGSERSIDSIIVNAVFDNEIIIVDGAPTDKPLERAKHALRSYPHAHVICEPDNGVYDAWNKAIVIGSGDWYSFIGCGDALAADFRQKC